MSPREVIELSRECRAVDFTCCDLWGGVRRVSIPASRLDEALFAQGLTVDGETLLPDPETAFLDPIADQPTLSLICERDHPADPRAVARRAESLLGAARVATRPAFFLFRDARFHKLQVESVTETLQDVRTEMALALVDAGIEVALHRAGDAPGQCRIDLAPASLVRHADALVRHKHLVRGVARQNGLVATFLPQPLFDVPGSEMPVDVRPEQDAPGFLGGVAAHAAALCALARPTTNSYRGDRRPSVDRGVFVADPAAHPYLALAAIALAGLDGIARGLEPGDAAPPADLGAALDALAEDSGFLTDGGVFPPEMVREYIDGKREREVEALRRRPHPYELALYFGV